MLLTAQLLVAAHACPGAVAMQAAVVHAAAAPCDSTVVPCEHAGPSNLCAEHCHQGQQSDQVPSLPAPAAVLAGSYPLPDPQLRVVRTGRRAAPTDVLAPASPPHAIEHCVFRI